MTATPPPPSHGTPRLDAFDVTTTDGLYRVWATKGPLNVKRLDSNIPNGWDGQEAMRRLAVEVLALRTEVAAIEQRVRHDDLCPKSNNEGDEGEAPYICLGEDGEPIIEADDLGGVVDQLSALWGRMQDRAEKAEQLAARLREDGERDGHRLASIAGWLEEDESFVDDEDNDVKASRLAGAEELRRISCRLFAARADAARKGDETE